jgi:TonB family protein
VRLVGFLFILAMCVAAVAVSTAAQAGAVAFPQKPSDAAVLFPETVEGLTATLRSIFDAEKAQEGAKSAALYATLAIPDHAAWFANTFGDAEGVRLEAKYSEGQEQSSLRLKKRVQWCLAQGKTVLGVHLYVTPADSTIPLTKAVLTAMTHATRMYQASCSTGPEDKTVYALGDFVYVQGGFRYMDEEVMRALSTAPPMRVRVGGEVQSAKLVNHVKPVYPHEAWIAGIEGIVKLHVLLGTDGSVKEVQVVSGHPLLVQAALDAVRDWKYKPTTLNGVPVEIDTEIDVEFSLKK